MSLDGERPVVRITRHALESALMGAKNSYPSEFLGLFRERDGILCELFLAPLSISDENSATFPVFYMPTDPTIVATFHSHPSHGVAQPSRADKDLFSRHYRIHFIASLPYTPQSTYAFNNEGEAISFEIIDWE
ncbi:MAG: Mov34/MPN/PAD-1 family protein [Candidatus Micrarchaeota archaeon]